MTSILEMKVGIKTNKQKTKKKKTFTITISVEVFKVVISFFIANYHTVDSQTLLNEIICV